MFFRAPPSTPSTPLFMGNIDGVVVKGLGRSALASQVIEARVRPSPVKDESNATDLVAQTVEALQNVRTLTIYFLLRPSGWKDFDPLITNAIQPAMNLRRARMEPGTFGAVVTLLNNAPALEYLELYFYTIDDDTETDLSVSAAVLPHLRRLILGSPIDALPAKLVFQILEYSGSTLWSLTINVSMSEMFESVRQSAGCIFAGALVHLSLMCNEARLNVPWSRCMHSRDERRNEILRACSIVRACPHLAHLELHGYHAEDLPEIFATVTRPLLSLAITAQLCDYIYGSTMIRPMLEEGHRAVSRLRLLVLHGAGSEPDWTTVLALCRKQRITFRLWGDLVSLMACRGISKFRGVCRVDPEV